MPALTIESQPTAANPLDLMEQIVGGYDWSFDRRTDTENGRRGSRQMV